QDFVDRELLRCFADRIVAVSHHAAERLERTGYPKRAIVCVPNGIDLERVQASRTPLEVRHALGIGDEESVIGTAGRRTSVEGQRYLIDAAPLILREETNARFLFVGGGPLKLDLAARAR